MSKDSKETKQTSGGTKTHVEIKAENLTPEERKFLEEHASELSPTTLRAKWINNLNEHEDQPGQTLATQNPEVIKHWQRSAVAPRQRCRERSMTIISACCASTSRAMVVRNCNR